MEPEDGVLFGCGVWMFLGFLVVALSLLWLAIVLAKAVIHVL